MVRNALRSAQETTQQNGTHQAESRVISLGAVGTTRAYSSSMSTPINTSHPFASTLVVTHVQGFEHAFTQAAPNKTAVRSLLRFADLAYTPDERAAYGLGPLFGWFMRTFSGAAAQS